LELACSHSDPSYTQDALANALTCKELLPRFRAAFEGEGFDVTTRVFRQILERHAELSDFVHIHQPKGGFSATVLLPAFEAQLREIIALTEEPALFKEPLFLPLSTSTPLQRDQLLPRTPKTPGPATPRPAQPMEGRILFPSPKVVEPGAEEDPRPSETAGFDHI
jgi:hypothetical protein